MRYLLFLNLLALTYFSVAQSDTIKFVNGSKKPAKIIEITDKYVRFKNPLDTSGPSYKVPLREVEQFILKDGCIDLRTKGYDNCKKDPTYGVIRNEDFTRTIVSLDALQLLFLHFQASLDHIFKNRKYGISVYGNYGLSDGTDPATYDRLETRLNARSFYKEMYGGIDFKIFPALHKKITYWLSFGAETGTASQMYTDADTVYYNGTPHTQRSWTVYTEKKFVAYHFNNGFLLRLNKHFICQGFASLGVNQFQPAPRSAFTRKYYFAMKFGLGLLVGYAF